jgi:hypothetical protein
MVSTRLLSRLFLIAVAGVCFTEAYKYLNAAMPYIGELSGNPRPPQEAKIIASEMTGNAETWLIAGLVCSTVLMATFFIKAPMFGSHKALVSRFAGAFQSGGSMAPFKYVDFYDVPRLILLKYRDHLFLLASYFDEEKDDYDDKYSVDILPPWVEQKIGESNWRVLEGGIEGRRQIGEIPVKDIVFDQTKRRALDPTFLDKYMN